MSSSAGLSKPCGSVAPGQRIHRLLPWGSHVQSHAVRCGREPAPCAVWHTRGTQVGTRGPVWSHQASTVCLLRIDIAGFEFGSTPVLAPHSDRLHITWHLSDGESRRRGAGRAIWRGVHGVQAQSGHALPKGCKPGRLGSGESFHWRANGIGREVALQSGAWEQGHRRRQKALSESPGSVEDMNGITVSIPPTLTACSSGRRDSEDRIHQRCATGAADGEARVRSPWRSRMSWHPMPPHRSGGGLHSYSRGIGAGVLYGVGKFLRTRYDGTFQPSPWGGTSVPQGPCGHVFRLALPQLVPRCPGRGTPSLCRDLRCGG